MPISHNGSLLLLPAGDAGSEAFLGLRAPTAVASSCSTVGPRLDPISADENTVMLVVARVTCRTLGLTGVVQTCITHIWQRVGAHVSAV